ncbi:MAG: FixH family protein [Azoarcus sp.]|jgi:hypothetical protein|nr:FixH family protein [Azoarcus sp.]
MDSQTIGARDEPWYRQGWPWFLIALPATAVVGGIAILIFAQTHWDGLVSGDYYKEGQGIVQVVERYEYAQEIGLSAHARVRDGGISVELSAVRDVDLPATIYLTIVHPTQSGSDQQVVLQRGLDGLYSGEIVPLRAGRWHFRLEDSLRSERELRNERKLESEARSWRMNGTANLPTETEILFEPFNS